MISFETWLKKQVNRRDATGKLARDYMQACLIIRSENPAKFKNKKIPIAYTFVEFKPCSEATRAYQEALNEAERLCKIKDDVYKERNMCIAALANFIRDLALLSYRVFVAEHEGEDWEDDWRTVLVIQKDDIQMTWHFHDSEKHLISKLPHMKSYHWDGHDTQEKYNRLIKCFIEIEP